MVFVLSEMNDPWGEEEPRSELMIKDEIAPFQILSRDIISSTGHLEPFTEKELARQAQNGCFPSGIDILNETGSEEGFSETLDDSERRMESAQTENVGRPSMETNGYMRATDQRQVKPGQNERKIEISNRNGRQPSNIPRRSADHSRQPKPSERTNVNTAKNVQNREGPSPVHPTRSKSIGSSPTAPTGSTVYTNSRTPNKISSSGITTPPSRVSPGTITTTSGGGSSKTRQNSKSEVSPSSTPVGRSPNRRPTKSSLISRQPQPESSSPMTPDGSYRLSMFDEFSVPPSSSSPPTKNELRNWDEVVLPTVRKNLKINPLSEWQDPPPVSPSHRRSIQISRASQNESEISTDGLTRREESSDVIEMNDLVDRPTNDVTDGGIGQTSQPFDHRTLSASPLPSAYPMPAINPSSSAQPTPALDSLGVDLGNDGQVPPYEQPRRTETLMDESQSYRSVPSDQIPPGQTQNRERQDAVRSERNVMSNRNPVETGTKPPQRAVGRNPNKGGDKKRRKGRSDGDGEVKGGCAGCVIM